MPNYKGHIIGGIIAYSILLTITALIYQSVTGFAAAEGFICTLAGSLFPDIDIKSKGQKLFYMIILISLIALFLFDRLRLASYISIASLAPLLVPHRGLFHRLWFIIGLSSFIALIFWQRFPLYKEQIVFDTIFFVGGAISHLWLDLGLKKMLRLK